MLTIAADNSIMWCVCQSVCHAHASKRKCWTDWGPIYSGGFMGPKEHCVRWVSRLVRGRGLGEFLPTDAAIAMLLWPLSYTRKDHATSQRETWTFRRWACRLLPTLLYFYAKFKVDSFICSFCQPEDGPVIPSKMHVHGLRYSVGRNLAVRQIALKNKWRSSQIFFVDPSCSWLLPRWFCISSLLCVHVLFVQVVSANPVGT